MSPPEPTGRKPDRDLLLSMRAQLEQAHLKLDHIIFRLQDDYYRHFYELYGPGFDR